MPVRPGWLAPTVMLALTAVLLIYIGNAAGALGPLAQLKGPRQGRISGIVPPRPATGLAPINPLGSGNLTYHGGSVMRTNTTYAIYWVPSGYSVGSTYRSTIDQYFGDVAADNGKTSNVYATDTQYSDTSGSIAYSSTFAGSVVVTTAFPAGDCFEPETSICLSDDQLQAEIQSVVEAHGWPENGHAVYFLFTPSDVGSCIPDLFGTSCAYEDYCAYHNSFATSGGEILYANQPWTYGTSGWRTACHCEQPFDRGFRRGAHQPNRSCRGLRPGPLHRYFHRDFAVGIVAPRCRGGR